MFGWEYKSMDMMWILCRVVEPDLTYMLDTMRCAAVSAFNEASFEQLLADIAVHVDAAASRQRSLTPDTHSTHSTYSTPTVH